MVNIKDLENMKFPYRKKLDIPSNVNFGYEIGFNDCKIDKLAKKITKKYNDKYGIIPDLSMSDSGCEIITPVLNNKKET